MAGVQVMLDNLDLLLTNWFWIGLVSTLLCGLVISPVLASLFVEGYNSLGIKKADFNTRLGSTVHALIVGLCGLYVLTDPVSFGDKLHSPSRLAECVLQLSLGYFTADYILILLDPQMRKDKGSHAHHFVSFTGVAVSLYYKSLVFFVLYRLINEFSTPFVNLFLILNNLKKTKGRLYLFASGSMMIMFFLCRLVPMPLHWYWIYDMFHYSNVFSDPDVNLYVAWYIFLVYPTYDLLNIYWFWKMFKGFIKFLSKGSKRHD